jgi:hypothetical protein
MRPWAFVAALFFSALTANAAPTQAAYRPGDMFEIQRDVESTESATGGSTSSSTDRDPIMERVVGAGQAGLELEYDLTKDTTAEDRARQWQFPARVLRPPHGPLQLLNRPELEARNAAWLKAGGLSSAACGHWYFTWNAFRIDCDPQSVLEIIEGFDLGPDDLSNGVLYQDAKALNPATLKQKAVSADGATFYVELPVSPDAVRRDQANTDVVTSEILHKPVTFGAALHARSAEAVSGTIAITFETDSTGRVRRQTKVTRLSIKGKDGGVETRTVTETLERRLISRSGA